MKICSIRIKGFQQYRDTYIDFTDPATGKPSNKICIIGKNGTGKSTLLNLIVTILDNLEPLSYTLLGSDNVLPVKDALISVEVIHNEEKFFYLINQKRGEFFPYSIQQENKDWFDVIYASYKKNEGIPVNFQKYLTGSKLNLQELELANNSTDLLIHATAESVTNNQLTISDVPATDLNQALALFSNFPYYHIINNDTVADFWKILIYLIKKRENEREEYENKAENLDKTKSQLIKEFEEINPKILNKIADQWNRILGKAGLEFDVEQAKNPIQLNENLQAYVTIRKTKERIEYNNLSTGIRNFIFRIGHIYSLYFNREVKRGFVMIDEPENSLFPDFLYDLVEVYQKALTDKNGENNSQLFMSTHSPIIAAQFEPYERVILDWDEEGYVVATKGIAPIGDDPNDVLLKDFNLTHVMGKKGQDFWKQYVNLKQQLRRTENEPEKEKLVKEILEIGTKYNFS